MRKTLILLAANAPFPKSPASYFRFARFNTSPLASHADVLRVRHAFLICGAGTRDEPLRTSAWEAINQQTSRRFFALGRETYDFVLMRTRQSWIVIMS